MTPRDGFWMSTYSGQRIYIDDPRPEDFRIVDIAHGLSNAGRYSGQCVAFFSVAEHCYRASRRASPVELIADYTLTELKLAYELLMHDSSEAYLGDMVASLKRYMPDYQKIEDNFMAAIGEAFKFPVPMTPECHEIDRRMLRTEAPVMFKHNDRWWDSPAFGVPFENEWIRDRFNLPAEADRAELISERHPDNEFMQPRFIRRLFLERYNALRKRIAEFGG